MSSAQLGARLAPRAGVGSQPGLWFSNQTGCCVGIFRWGWLGAFVASKQHGKREREWVAPNVFPPFASRYLVPVYISVMGLVHVPCRDNVVVSCRVRKHAYCPSRLVCLVVFGCLWCSSVLACLSFGGWALIARAR